ncbi:flagellar hook-length control protein FliK [Thaumasiovibrio sp. DFM-14]|uniref:flagellar hook-length control protein FliK n=1 Tax=Thaumasiovibrio sp. DFM-14 TaxID=3384792 RepID=UPI0039A2F961
MELTGLFTAKTDMHKPQATATGGKGPAGSVNEDQTLFASELQSAEKASTEPEKTDLTQSLDVDAKSVVVSDRLLQDEQEVAIDTSVAELAGSEAISQDALAHDAMTEGEEVLTRLRNADSQLQRGKALPSEQADEFSKDEVKSNSEAETAYPADGGRSVPAFSPLMAKSVGGESAHATNHIANNAANKMATVEWGAASKQSESNTALTWQNGTPLDTGVEEAAELGRNVSDVASMRASLLSESGGSTDVAGAATDKALLQATQLSAPSSQQAAQPLLLQHGKADVQLPLNLQQTEAQQAVADKVQIMLSNNLKHVDIRLDPPELGRVQIKLQLNQDQANVQFTVSTSQAREAIEQSLPRLREMLQQQGLQLTQGDVQQESRSQQQGQFAGRSSEREGAPSSPSGAQGVSDHDEHGVANDAVELWVNEQSHGVDYYA